MNLLLRARIISLRRRGGPQDVGRRPRTKWEPSYEALDDRQLLSTMNVTSAVLPVPTASEVASAAATLNALNPTAFAQFQGDLAKAESQSRVSMAQASGLARDEKIIDQAIATAGLDANTTSTVLNQVQTEVDNAFLENTLSASSWVQQQQGLTEELAQDVPSVHFSSFFVRDTIDQMQRVAREARHTPQINDAVSADWAALSNELGSTPDTNVGTGSANLDALEVYYEGQVNNFIK